MMAPAASIGNWIRFPHAEQLHLANTSALIVCGIHNVAFRRKFKLKAGEEASRGAGSPEWNLSRASRPRVHLIRPR